MARDSKQEIEDLFSMFHDFEITSLTLENKSLDLTIRIPWGELWDDLDYQIRVLLNPCDFIRCEYSELLNTPDNLSKKAVDRSYVDKTTSNPQIISELGLEVQRYNFSPPNVYEFLCNSSKNYAGGKLIFTAESYILLDKEGSKIELDQMKKWCTDWWKKIENQ